MIVVDASVLIAQLDSDDAQHRLAVSVLLAVADEELAASPLTLAEVLVGPARSGRLELATAMLRQLAISTVPLQADAPVRLAALRAETRLRVPDCCVLLAAEERLASVATFDRTLARAASSRGLRLVAP